MAAGDNYLKDGELAVVTNKLSNSIAKIIQIMGKNADSGEPEEIYTSINRDVTVLASAARIATVNSADLTNYNGRGVHVILDVTSVTATPTITLVIQGKDPVSGSYYDILRASGATIISATGLTVFKVYPGITALAGGAANDVLPRIWRVRVEHADADSITYSVGAEVIV
jgi:hypothetical protein